MHSSGFQTYYSDAVAGLDLNQATKVTCRPFRTYYVDGANDVIYGIKLLSSFTRVQAKSEFGDDLTLDGGVYDETRKDGYIGGLDGHLVSHTIVNGPFKEVKVIDGLAELQAVGEVKVRDSFDIDADMDIYARFDGTAHTDYMTPAGIYSVGPIASGTKIQTWLDQSGNGHNITQTTSGNQPQAFYATSASQRDGMSFNETNQEHFTASSAGQFDFGIQSSSGLDMQSWSIVAVINTQGGYNGTICSRGNTAVSSDLQYWLLVDGQSFAGGIGGCTYATGPTAVVGDEWITGGTVIIMATIGVLDQDAYLFHYRATDADGTNLQVAGDLSPLKKLHVGLAQTTFGYQYGFTGFMHELIFINNRQNSNDDDIGWGSNQMTYEQLDALGNYLSKKWQATWVAGVT